MREIYNYRVDVISFFDTSALISSLESLEYWL